MRTVHAIAITSFLVGFAVSLQWYRVGEVTLLVVLLLPVAAIVAAYVASIIFIGMAERTKPTEWPQIAKRLFGEGVAK